MSFPQNLVAYEIALERAFRMLLGSQLDSHDMPDQEEVGDAFYRKVDPSEFARLWVSEEKYRLKETPPAEDDTNNPFNPQEDELF